MFKKYKETCEFLHLSYKKDLIFTLIFTIAMFALGCFFIFFYQSIIGVFLFIMGISYIFSHLIALENNKRQLIDSKEIAFSSLYRYIISILENGEILYAALKKSLEYCDSVLSEDLENFIVEIENDTSLQPFINFSSNFNDETIKQMIILLYQTQESETINYVLEKINNCLVNLQDTSINSYVQKEEKKIERFYIFPIILSAIVIIIVSFFIFSIIGEGTYV